MVVKNSSTTGTAIGQANGVRIFSIVRDYFSDPSVHQTSLDWAIVNYDADKLLKALEIVQKSLLKYEQMRPPRSHARRPTAGVVRQFHFSPEFESLDKIIEVFTSVKDSDLRVVVLDEENFFDRTKSSMVGGPFAEIINK
ncbi:hypothetical protein PHLGIDRAFT_117191 [Phlebiopsis gigantea 11061_1 CR5-6]|uniref:Uncharacterized protein n=1 Tax=Phlebiopsis gigantea (strain 11061_1 CR5-6) TaxID=745531 RepID=A0A0C3NT78_PHLG1|nr:hypothetical protein PHLGIDRAFT_117191 [Phlebiopsis gigantea 11061_1 CR5-6]